jgi:hypothetical protein
VKRPRSRAACVLIVVADRMRALERENRELR